MSTGPQTPSPGLVVPDDPQSIAFVKGLVDRGEAVAPAPDGSVDRKATHVIVGQTDAGHPIVKRVRFSAV